MSILKTYFSGFLHLMQIPITIWGFTFTFWDIFMLSMIITVCWWLFDLFFIGGKD